MAEGDRQSRQISPGGPLEDPTTAAYGSSSVQRHPTSQIETGSPVERHEKTKVAVRKTRSANSEAIANTANIQRNQSVFQRPARSHRKPACQFKRCSHA